MTIHGRLPLSAAQTSPAAPQADAIDLRHLQDFFWRRWRLILSAAAIICAVTYVVLLTVTPRYTATAQVLLDNSKQNIFGAQSIIPDLDLDNGNVDSQISVIRSVNLLQHVVERANLIQNAELAHPPSPNLFASIVGLFHEPANVEPPAVDGAAISPVELRVIGRLREMLDVTRVQRTYVLSISMTMENADEATRIANAVADAYLVDQLDARYDGAKRASTWLADQMQALGAQVHQSEQAVADFRQAHNLQQADSQSTVTLTGQQLSELNAKLVSARANTAEAFAKYQQVQQLVASNGNLQTIPDVVKSTVISQLRSQEADVARREADLESRYSDNHPLVINVRAERRNIEQSISAEVNRIVANLKNDYDVAKAGRDSLQQSIDQMSGASGGDNTIGVQLRALERVNQANKTLFEDFLSRAKITQEQSSFQQQQARLITPATRPGVPSFPKKPLVLSLAAVVGFLVGIGGSVALDLLNSGFLTPREIEEKLGVPVLASVPMLRDSERKVGGKLLDPADYLRARPLSRFSESLRATRVGIQMSDVDNPAKVILVTSSVPFEGKTTLAISLARSALSAGMKVVLIDGDLRHPTITKYFGFGDRPGLSDLLTHMAKPEDGISVVDGLVVIPAGAKSQNPPDLLGSLKMRQLVQELRECYDYVVIDSPPVGPVIDAKVTSQLVDKLIYVVRWRDTSRELVEQHVRTLDETRKLAGVVLNLVDETKAPRYGPYAYYRGYYYKKYYEN